MLDLKGKKFNKLTGIQPTKKRKDNKIVWLWKCDCGKEHEATGRDVKSGHTKSCGCLNIERVTNMGKANKTHGHASGGKLSKTYMVWSSMLRRCRDKNHKSFPIYGGRGITVCKEWLPENDGYNNFLKDMGKCPRGHQIDRINNDKLIRGYSPENCHWTTSKINNRNRRSNHLIPFNGKELTIVEWSEITGINKRTILRRIAAGWTPEEALTIPPDTRHNWRTKK
jgi:hypothetical protein